METLIADLQKSEEPRKLTEERKEFLLTDQQVTNRIISGLVKDFKLL